ncbi:unnamed protein product [Cylindrotheca closterium]|uniref:Uncharacterized protein n=1 Tax=Cylindrotheca closterium TaxID=2856 RepID=A0AAD2PUX9_9STRA|nr:unnamed protein product [Cylindrotheca closterium]
MAKKKKANKVELESKYAAAQEEHSDMKTMMGAARGMIQRLVLQEGNKEELDKIEASIAKAKLAHTELQDDSVFLDAMTPESRKAYTDHLEDRINANMALVKKSRKKPCSVMLQVIVIVMIVFSSEQRVSILSYMHDHACWYACQFALIATLSSIEIDAEACSLGSLLP